MQENGRVSWINMPKIVKICVCTRDNMFEKLLKQLEPIFLSHFLRQLAAFFILLSIKLQLWLMDIHFIQLRTSLKRVLMLLQQILLQLILSFVLNMFDHYNLWLAFYVIPIVKCQGNEAMTFNIDIHKFWSCWVVLMAKITKRHSLDFFFSWSHRRIAICCKKIFIDARWAILRILH